MTKREGVIAKPKDQVSASYGEPLKLMGISVHPAGVENVHTYIKNVIDKKEKALVLNVNIHAVNLALQNSWLKDFLNSAQLVFCDGDGIRWGLKLLGYEPPPKVTYDRWIWQLAEFCENKNYSIYFLGGKPGIAAQAQQKLQARFPKLNIAGAEHGHFRKTGEENERILQEINRIKPDILMLGFGMPLQERWLKDHWREIDAHIFLTGGAVFDYLSGKAQRAPNWMIQAHLEWFYRFLREPGRLFRRYFFGIPYFFMRIFGEKMKSNRIRKAI